MKKTFLWIIMAIISMGFAYAQKIRVLSPNGGETLVNGTPMLITWNHFNLEGDETVLIALEGSVDFGPITYTKAASGSFEWLAGQKMDGSFAKPGTDYRIIIEVWDNDSVSDLSDGVFTITMPPSAIAIMTPNGGEMLEKGKIFDINWSSSSKEGYVSLNLIKDDQPLGLIAENLPAASLRYSWHVGDPLLNGLVYAAGGNYRIQVQWRARPFIHTDKGGAEEARTKGKLASLAQKNSDRSDNAFQIIDAAAASPQNAGKEKKQ